MQLKDGKDRIPACREAPPVGATSRRGRAHMRTSKSILCGTCCTGAPATSNFREGLETRDPAFTHISDFAGLILIHAHWNKNMCPAFRNKRHSSGRGRCSDPDRDLRQAGPGNDVQGHWNRGGEPTFSAFHSLVQPWRCWLIMAPTVKAGDHESLPAPAAKPDDSDSVPGARPFAAGPGDRTRTATPTAAPELQPSVVAPLHRNPERYQILGEHGRGGLGRVSRARDVELGRDVAIKELISRTSISEVRFLREAMITARLEHPGIVPVHEAGRWPDGTPFYAMKLVSGRPLRELIAERTTVDQRIGLLHHVIAVADAIAYAHERNIIHRDLKPANVIVGEFGETIVIDWGLAKDLSTTEETAVHAGPFRTAQDDGLTAAGAILGTPTYMPPEQERGEHVDQRADVFAIGAMLWELCSLEKVPPTNLRQRHRTYRRSGIDRDLAVIVDKALSPDPKLRYPDAGALAADLKAFKSGARIGARNYSLFAMLAHWTRRHRTLAVSATAAVVLAAASGALFVHRIASERDRADNALERAEGVTNELILQQAELLLRVDPTSAVDVLKSYHGDDRLRLDMLRAQAHGFGVSHVKAVPHGDNIFFAQPLPDRTILTMGLDNAIVKTDERGQSRLVARSSDSVFAYSDTKGLFAYACEAPDRNQTPTDDAICLIEAGTERRLQVPADMMSLSPTFLAFSPHGNMLAAVSRIGDIVMWNMSATTAVVSRYHDHILAGADYLLFVDDETLVVASSDRIHLGHVSNGSLASVQHTLSVQGVKSLAANAEGHMLAVATDSGSVLLVDTRRGDVTQQRALCTGAANSVVWVAGGSFLGYACQDGDVGAWNLESQSGTVLAHIDGGVSTIASSSDGTLLVAGANNGKLLVYNTDTKMSEYYIGHSSRIMALFGSSPTAGYIISADSSGKLRAWPLPRSGVRAMIQSPTRLISAALLSSNGPVIAVRANSSIPVVTLDGRSSNVSEHLPARIALAWSNAEHVALYGADENIELWSFDAPPTRRLLKTSHDIVTAARYLAGNRLVSAGHDGRVLEWSPEGEFQREVISIHEPVVGLTVLRAKDAMFVVGASGALWYVDHSRSLFIERLPGPVTARAVSRDSQFIALAISDGSVRLYDTQTLAVRTLFNERVQFSEIAFSANGLQIAMIAHGVVRVVSTHDPREESEHFDADKNSSLIDWDRLDIHARSVSFSPDGNWVALMCDNGMVWLHAIHKRSWINVPVSIGDVFLGHFSEDSNHLLTTDSKGQATLIDMRDMRNDPD